MRLVHSWPTVLTQATLFGREAYRQAILQRLIPSLRAFNPSLILLSSGFDAAAGDVGNCRNYPGLQWERGMDLSPEDFAWATAEVMKIADLCCNGKLVSVLEGGYGEYEQHGRGNGAKGGKPPATRLGTRHSSAVPEQAVQVSAHYLCCVCSVRCTDRIGHVAGERHESRRAVQRGRGARTAPY